MEINEQNLNILVDLLHRTVSANNESRKEAENYIFSIETQPGFLIVLLHLISSLSSSQISGEMLVRQVAAVFFKNAVKRHWDPQDSQNEIIATDKLTIKSSLVELMSSTPLDVQKQLAEAVTIISNSDFPDKWTDLLPRLVSMLCLDLNINKGVMLTANSIMKRFRYAPKSDELYKELDMCLKGFQVPLLQLYERNGGFITDYANDKNKLLVAFETQRLMTRIFFSLNWQDIPEYFEDNSLLWMTEFSKYLSYSNPLLEDPSEENEPGPIEKLQSAIIENLNLYASKYEEEFMPYLPQFTQVIWKLLTNAGPQPKYDSLTINGIKFLTSVCSKQMNTPLFTDPVLRDIVEQIVVRNVTATESDEEMFECNPTEYIRKDIEGSDQDTRRRCASELIRSLLKFFDVQISQLSLAYIRAMLEQYQKSLDWKAKDAALHLVLAISVMSSNSLTGAGALNPLVNILEIFTSHVLPEIQDTDVNARPIVKADAIKLICVFRSHLQAPFLLEILPHIIKHLFSSCVVIQTYAALCIERFLMIKDMGENRVYTQRITKVHLIPYLDSLFTGLFQVLDNPELPENDYVMKCVMRVLSALGSDFNLGNGIADVVFGKIMLILERISKNAANPHFNHYLFECISLIIRSSCQSSADASVTNAYCERFEGLLFPPFQSILALDVVEFVPYVFQILAQLLSSRPAGSRLSSSYQALFVPLLSPSLWERKGNIPALIDLFRAYITVGMEEIVAGNYITGVLGIFQKLLSAKATEVQAFALLNALIANSSIAVLSPYLQTIFSLLLHRMQDQMKDSNTPRYCRYFLHTLSHFAVAYGGAMVYDILEGLTAGLTSMVINVWKNNSSLCANLEIAQINEMIAGGTKLLVQTPINSQPDLWLQLLQVIIPLIQAQDGKSGKSDDESSAFVDEEAEAREFDSAYSKLAFSQLAEPSPNAEAAAASVFFATSLSQLTASRPGYYLQVIQHLEPDNARVLQELFQQQGLKLL